jgi:hypothetical protein
LGAATRALDWSRTPIGPADGWPPSLRTAVSVCLSSRFPIVLWWGPELVLLYNDDYRSVLGAKHPDALGRPGEEVWHEIWDFIGPMLHGVLERGEATWSDDQLLVLERGGYIEEAYFTFSYSPIRDETGAVGGVFCAVHETTDRVLGDRRLETLSAMADHAGRARTPADVLKAAIAALETNPEDVPYAAVYGRDAGGAGTGAELLVATSAAAGRTAAPAHIAADDAGAPWPITAVLESGEPVVLWRPPAQTDDVRLAEALIVPVALPTEPRPSRAIVFGVNRRRVLDDAYRRFFDLAAATSPRRSRAPPPTRPSAPGPRRSSRSTRPRPSSSRTSATSSVRR